MASWRDRLPGAFEPPPEKVDILAEERERRSTFWSRVRSGPWPAGRLGLALLAVFLAGGLAFAFVSRSGGGEFEGYRFPADGSLGGGSGNVVQPGTVEDVVMGWMFGEPKGLGVNGLPVVVHEVTGETRELTPVEVRFYEESEGDDVPFLPGDGERVVWSPGPGGWGMWWKHDPVLEALAATEVFDRRGWLEKQRLELQLSVDDVGVAVAALSQMEFDPWRTGVSDDMYWPLDRVKDRYGLIQAGAPWASVPLQWQCSVALEVAVWGSVTNGCPPDNLMDALSEVWARLGALVDQLYGISRLGVAMDNMKMSTHYDMGVLQQQGFSVLEVEDDLFAFYFGLAQLQEYSTLMGYPIVIDSAPPRDAAR